MILRMGIDGLWELRSVTTNEIMFQMHDDDIPWDEDPEYWVRCAYELKKETTIQ